jgi:rhodanese-related sulfurtransferase
MINFQAISAGLLLLLAPMLVAHAQSTSPAPYNTISSRAFASRTNEAVLVDVREASEWAQTGVPADAKRISISRPDFVEAVLAAVNNDRSKPVAVICRSGTRSVRAAEQLAAAGFSSVINIGDGMIGRDGVGGGWLAANLPLTRAQTGE